MSNLLSIQEILNAQHDSSVNVPNYQAASYASIITSAQTTIKSSAGVLFGITLNAQNTSAIRCYDNIVSGVTTILTIPAATAAGTNFRYGLKFSTGLTVSSGSSDTNITVLYL